MSELEGLAIDDLGLDKDNGLVSFCTTCENSLRRRRIPRLSLKNGHEVGRVPECLRVLTWAEQRLVALYNIHIHLIHFRNQDVPGEKRLSGSEQKQPHCKSGAVCVPQDTLGVNRLLPPPMKDCSKMFQVLDPHLCNRLQVVCRSCSLVLKSP